MNLKRSMLLALALFVPGSQARLKRTRTTKTTFLENKKGEERGERGRGREREPPAPLSLQSKCPVHAEISCNELQDGKDCNSIMIESGRCRQIKVEYQFKYCNMQPMHQKGHQSPISEIRGTCRVNRGKILQESIQDDELEPERCRILRHVVQLDSCAHVFQANMDLEVWMNENVVCKARDMLKVVRPLFRSSERKK